MPHTPYVGDVCPGGEDACIDDVVTEMQDRLDGLAAACDHDAVFSLAYLRVTENVRDAARSGYFQDRKWLTQVDAVFAELYFEVRDDWHAGRRAQVPQAWAIALQAEDDKAMTGLGNFMLAMNAHINRDFPHVLAEVGLTAPDGTSHRPDHNAYNQRLDSLYAPVFAEEAARFDPRFDDIDISTLEETTAGVIMRGWREGVWRHAEELALAKTPCCTATGRAADRGVRRDPGTADAVDVHVEATPAMPSAMPGARRTTAEALVPPAGSGSGRTSGFGRQPGGDLASVSAPKSRR